LYFIVLWKFEYFAEVFRKPVVQLLSLALLICHIDYKQSAAPAAILQPHSLQVTGNLLCQSMPVSNICIQNVNNEYKLRSINYKFKPILHKFALLTSPVGKCCRMLSLCCAHLFGNFDLRILSRFNLEFVFLTKLPSYFSLFIIFACMLFERIWPTRQNELNYMRAKNSFRTAGLYIPCFTVNRTWFIVEPLKKDVFNKSAISLFYLIIYHHEQKAHLMCQVTVDKWHTVWLLASSLQALQQRLPSTHVHCTSTKQDKNAFFINRITRLKQYKNNYWTI